METLSYTKDWRGGLAGAVVALALAIGLAGLAPCAYADDLRQGGIQGELSVQTSYYSDYALLASDNKVYPCDSKGAKLSDYWTRGALENSSAAQSSAEAAIEAVTTLFIAADVTDLDIDRPAAEYQYVSYSTTYVAKRNVNLDNATSLNGTNLSSLKRVVFLTDSQGKSSVLNIGSSCFEAQTNLASVENFDKTQLHTVPSECFKNCTRLTTITLPATCTKVDPNAFQGCAGLSNMNFDAALTTLGQAYVYNYGVFKDCTALKTLDFPEAFTTISNSAFSGCSNLTKVILRRTADPVSLGSSLYGSASVFDNTPIDGGDGYVYVPNSLLSDYRNEKYWSNYKDNIRPFFSVDAISGFVYDGSEKRPPVTVRWIGDVVSAENYTVSYSDNVEAGTATVTVSGKGPYAGNSDSTTFEIAKLAISSDSVSASISDQVYDGTAKTPDPTVKLGSKTLMNGVDYTVAYVSNKNVGTATATISGMGNFTGTRDVKFNIVNPQQPQEQPGGDSDSASEPAPTRLFMYRLYNPYSGEHFYTSDATERDAVMDAGWTFEGDGWVSPTSGDPVYRMYNRWGGEHHYTLDEVERDYLESVGWEYEGIGWYSDPSETIPLYRQYNPYAFSNNHNYTVSTDERDFLVGLGWVDEGIAWYGI